MSVPSPVRLTRTRLSNALPLRLLVTGVVGLLVMTLVGVYLATADPTSGTPQTVGDCSLLVAVLVGAISCARVALRRDASSRGWFFLSLAFLCWTFGAAVTVYYGVTRDHVYPSPSLADVGFLSYPIPVVLALIAFPRTPALLVSRVRAASDAAVIALSVLFLSVETVLDSMVHSLGELGVAERVMLAYPIVDVVICSVVFTLNMRRPVGQRLNWGLLGVGMVALSITDGFYLRYLAQGGTAPTGQPLVVGWMCAALLVTLATLTKSMDPEIGMTRRASLSAELTPYVPLLAAMLVMILHDVHRHPAVLLVGMLLLVTVVARQVMILLENVTLTGRLEKKVDELNSLGSIVTSSSDAIVGISVEGLVTSCNPAAERLFGYPAPEVVGFAPPLTPEQRERLRELIESARRGETLTNAEITWPHPDGTLVAVALAISPIFLGASFEGISISGQDIGERQRIAAALEQARLDALEASRLKSEFLATMSHEIRTPMNGVIGLTGLLLNTQLTNIQRQYAQGVQSAGDALLTVINDVLDFSKLEAGKVELDVRAFDLRRLVDEVGGLLAPAAHGKGLELMAYCLPGVPSHLLGDAGRIRQIVLNLVSNAVKFTSSGEVGIKVSSSPRDGSIRVRFEVSDTGIGIAEHGREVLFTSFSQADVSTTRRYGGTGLGLAISSRLVQAMNGEIGLESEPGQGSTFWFELPLDVAPQAPPEAVTPTPELLAESRVLVVDDNATNRQVLEGQLAAWRLRPDLVEDAATALTQMHTMAARGLPYDFALLDMCMPGTDGLQLAREISSDKLLRDTHLLVLSSTLEVDISALQDAGVADWMTKPVRSSELFDRLARLRTPSGPHPDSEELSALPEGKRTVSRGRVLVVEDNELNQLVAQGTMTLLGYSATIVSNGVEALDALRQNDYAAVLMDCHMPIMDGFETTRRIRSGHGPNQAIPIIAMTAEAMPEDRDRCLAAGMDDYVSKPVAIEAVDQVLQKWVVTVDESQAPPQDLPGQTPSPPPDEQEAVDPQRIEMLRQLGSRSGSDLLVRVAGLFTLQAPESLADISEAVRLGHFDEVEAAAHKLRGACSNIGAAPAAALCLLLEQDSHALDQVVTDRLLEQLGIELERASTALSLLSVS